MSAAGNDATSLSTTERNGARAANGTPITASRSAGAEQRGAMAGLRPTRMRLMRLDFMFARGKIRLKSEYICMPAVVPGISRNRIGKRT